MSQHIYKDRVTENIKARDILFILTLRKYSSAMYAIFCGAPGHLTGLFGKVNIAVPLLILEIFEKTCATVSGP